MPRSRRRRYWIGAALGALALTSPLAIAAAPASAQGFDFISASGDGSGHLSITVSSGAPLTDWTLSLANATSGTYTLDDFADFADQDTFAADQPQTYVLTKPSDLEAATVALPPGVYTVTVTAANDGGVDTLASPQTITSGTFNFLAQPTLAITGSAFNTTQPDQPVTIKGQITGCSTLACPGSWSNTPVTVTDVTAAPRKPQWTGSTTDSAGDFSVSGVTGVPGDYYSASVQAIQGTSLPATAPSDTQDLPEYAGTSITATAANAPYGKQTINGQLTYQPASGLTPVDAPAGVPISATAPGKKTVNTTTGSNGVFKLALPPITGTTSWLITASKGNDLNSTPFLYEADRSLSATQLWPVKISLSASVDKYGSVTVAGCMSSTISQPPPPDNPLMNFQWRSSRTGRWQWLGTRPTMKRDGCAGLGFAGSGAAPATSAYYRAYITGDNVYAPAVSASTGRVWIYPTRFKRFSASSQSVAPGQNVTISGILQYERGKWRGYGGQRIALIFSKNGKNNWYLPSNEAVKTNSKGAFSWTFSDTYRSAYWQAIFSGNGKHRYAASGLVHIKVRGNASAKLTAPVSPPTGLRPFSRLSDPSLGLASWAPAVPYAMSPDPWLALMGN